ncbi:hypothetical protein [Psychrobacillus sp. FSL H8-0510]|uniref:hypothetical protein n=1 Tax=Psychrobacillus sp. FSL H8-0510 TaxID=2921394 RepID=UPI0030F8E4F6
MPLQNTFTLDVDFKHKSIINEPTVTQNDEVTFILNVYDDGLEFDLSGVSTSTLVSERPDKQSVMTLGTVTGTNQITFALGSTEISKVGKVDATIQIYDVDGRVTTMPFTYKVLKDPGTGYIPSTNEQTLIELVLGEGPAILDATKQATIDANTATTNANDKASLANTAATNANTKANLANTAAINANEKATLADENADLANSAATYATTQGDYAKAKGDEVASIIANGPVSSVNGQTGPVEGIATTLELQALDDEVTAHIAEGSQFELYHREGLSLPIANGSGTTLPFTYREIASTGADFSEIDINGNVKFKRAGTYMMNVRVAFAQNGTGHRFFGVVYNGSIIFEEARDAAITVQTYLSLTKIVKVNVNDTIGIALFQDSGGIVEVDGNLSKTFLEINFLGDSHPT